MNALVMIHAELGRLGPGSDVDWSRVVVWWGDERFVAADSSERNARAARADFLDLVGVPAEHVHEMASTGEAADVEAGAAAYESLMRESGAGLHWTACTSEHGDSSPPVQTGTYNCTPSTIAAHLAPRH